MILTKEEKEILIPELKYPIFTDVYSIKLISEVTSVTECEKCKLKCENVTKTWIFDDIKRTIVGIGKYFIDKDKGFAIVYGLADAAKQSIHAVEGDLFLNYIDAKTECDRRNNAEEETTTTT